MSSIDFTLSLADLLLVDGFARAYASKDKEAIEQVLRQNGMNVAMGYEEVVCTHRSLTGHVVTCPRFEGFERTDKKWITKGEPSLAAIIASCTDPHLRVALRTMSREAAQDTIWRMLEDKE